MTTLKGYFPHVLPDTNPSNFQVAFVLALSGIQYDPQLDDNMKKTEQLSRLLYQRMMINGDNDVFDHASKMVEALDHNTAATGIIFNAMYMNLLDIQTYVSYFKNTAYADHPILFYTTHERWNAILKGADAGIMARRILDRADMCLSQWTEQPEKPAYVDKLVWWEDQSGIARFDDSGHVLAVPGSQPTNGGSTPGSGSNGGGTLPGADQPITIKHEGSIRLKFFGK